jgi:hypothetical protein
MLAALLLSADSAFTGAAIRLLPTTRNHLRLACVALGLADAIALLLGYSLRAVIAAAMGGSADQILLLSCVLAAVALLKASTWYPRASILAIAIVLSADNLLAGTQLSSSTSIITVMILVGTLSALASMAGIQCANFWARNTKPKAAFVFASISLVIGFLLS